LILRKESIALHLQSIEIPPDQLIVGNKWIKAISYVPKQL